MLATSSWPFRTSWLVPIPYLSTFCPIWLMPEIYRIVSSKALDSGDAAQAPSGGVKIDMTPSGTPDAKGNKCCWVMRFPLVQLGQGVSILFMSSMMYWCWCEVVCITARVCIQNLCRLLPVEFDLPFIPSWLRISFKPSHVSITSPMLSHLLTLLLTPQRNDHHNTGLHFTIRFQLCA